MKLSRIKKLVFLHLQHLPMKSRGNIEYICNKIRFNNETVKN